MLPSAVNHKQPSSHEAELARRTKDQSKVQIIKQTFHPSLARKSKRRYTLSRDEEDSHISIASPESTIRIGRGATFLRSVQRSVSVFFCSLGNRGDSWMDSDSGGAPSKTMAPPVPIPSGEPFKKTPRVNSPRNIELAGINGGMAAAHVSVAA